MFKWLFRQEKDLNSILAPLRKMKLELEERLHKNADDIVEAQKTITDKTKENGSIGEALQTDLFKSIK